MWRATRKTRRQLFISTHSSALLADESIAGEEVLLLTPTHEDTSVQLASDIAQVRALLEGGIAMGEAVLPRVAPERPEQLLLKLSE